ncbi:hypothetical protein L210DRAFT_3762081 [Boletus edulis BED1]|uniref:Uncharacterized protein n=1 Tax=Boletus edulis BED1 TaxID=1328754 RepID=A0AAD4BQ60_BOLED|nr:hypothetical protein L210DRAFT_3762081 [Boletus edulis BED1]
MATNTQTNSAPPQTRHVPRLLLSLFYTTTLYAFATLTVYFTLGSPKSDGHLFLFWIATTGSTYLFVIIGFFATNKQHVQVCRIVLHVLVVLQMYNGAVFLPEELWVRLRQDILIEASTAIILVIFECAIDCIYIFVTTQAASNDQGLSSIITIFRRWIAHMPTSESSRNDNGGLPVSFTEALPLQKPHAETDTGNLQTRILRMVQKMYRRRLLAQTNTEKDRLQTRPLHMTMYRHRPLMQIDQEKGHLPEDPEVI